MNIFFRYRCILDFKLTKKKNENKQNLSTLIVISDSLTRSIDIAISDDHINKKNNFLVIPIRSMNTYK